MLNEKRETGEGVRHGGGAVSIRLQAKPLSGGNFNIDVARSGERPVQAAGEKTLSSI